MNSKLLYVVGLVAALFSASAMAAEHTVGQKNKEFTVKEINIKVGDSVKFVNEDTFFHNVYSLSEKKMFDLGSYPQGESKTETFNTPGEIDVECAIHPNMHMKVKVSE